MLNSVRTIAFLAMAFLSANSSAQSQKLYEVGPSTETVRMDSISPTYYQSYGPYLFFMAIHNHETQLRSERPAFGGYAIWQLDTRDNSIQQVVNDFSAWTDLGLTYQVLNDKIIYFSRDGLAFKAIAGQEKTTIPELRNSHIKTGPDKMATFNGHVYFSTSVANSHHDVLWRTDGTVAGTKEVPLCVADKCYQSPERMVVSGNKLFLVSYSADRQPALWSIDSQNNAVLFNEVMPRVSNEEKLIPYQNGIHFNSNNGFWYSDGTKAGSYQITLDANKPDWRGRESVSLGNTLIVASYELYSIKEHGKGASTQVRLDPLMPNNVDSHSLPNNLTLFKNSVYFIASFYNPFTNLRTSKLMSYNGSATAKEIYTFEATDKYGYKIVGTKGGKLLLLRYTKRDLGQHNPETNEIWISDGTKAGTVKISDTGVPYNFWSLNAWKFVNNDFYFTGFSEQHGTELWRTDGTAEGTKLAKDLGYGMPRMQMGEMFSDGQQLYYQVQHAWQDESGSQRRDMELWRTDATTMRSAKVSQWSESNYQISPKFIAVENGQYWWVQSKADPFGQDLLFYNKHTEALGTVRTGRGECVNHMYRDRVLLTKGDQYFFYAPVTAGETSSCQLWVSDGTAAGTKAITNFPKIFHSWEDAITNLVMWNGEVYFSLNLVSEEHMERRTAVYKTNGTPEGTTEAFRLSEAGEDPRYYIEELLATENGIFIVSGYRDYKLWFRNSAGLTHLGTWSGSNPPRDFVRFGEGIAFVLGDAIYSSDGTVQGTKPLVTLHSSASEANEYPKLASTPDFKHLVFSAKDDSNKVRIWLSDGTSTGSRAVGEPVTEYDFIVHALVGDDLYISTFSRASSSQGVEKLMRYSIKGDEAEVIRSKDTGSQYYPFRVTQALGRIFITDISDTFSPNRIYATARLDNGDLDKDGVLNSADAFPLHSDEHLDTDGDGIGNNADLDDDGDEEPDNTDLFPLNGMEWADHDGDGIGDIADTDDDNDKVSDWDDAYPRDATRYTNTETIPVHLPVPPADKSSGGAVHYMAWFVVMMLALQRRRQLRQPA